MNPLHATVGFVDGDPFEDFVFGSMPGARVLLGNGDGTFQEGAFLPSIFFGRTVAVARVNDDAHADILFGDEQAGAIRVYLGDGNGGFSHLADAATQREPHHFDVALFDNDANVDLVVAFGYHLIGVFLGNGDGTFAAPDVFETGMSNRFTVAADYDGNGTADVAVTDRVGSTVSILAGVGDGQLGEPLPLATASSPEVLTVCDVTGDGPVDVFVLGGEADGSIALHTGQGNGFFNAPEIHSLGKAPLGMAAGDLNRDGEADILVASSGSGFASLLKGFLQVPLQLSLAADPLDIVAADLDGNPGLDLAVSQRDTGGLTFFFSDGAGGFQLGTLDATVVPTDILAVNFNGDSLTDLVVTDLLQGVTVWLGTGGGSYGPSLNKAAGLLSSAVAAGEISRCFRAGGMGVWRIRQRYRPGRSLSPCLPAS